MSRIAVLLFLGATFVVQGTKANAQSLVSSATQRSTSSTAHSSTAHPADSNLRHSGRSPAAAVITIHGLCSDAASHSSGCNTVITRRDFEAFVNMMNATTTRGVDPAFYRGLAEGYTALMVSSAAGERAGAERDLRFHQLLELSRLRALGGMYRSQQYKRALQSSSQDVDLYYKTHIADFEEVDLDRFLIPKDNPADLSDTSFQERSKRLAEDMHARALRGEDLAKLEKEALASLGDSKVPFIAIGVRRGQFEEKAEKQIFALGQNEVTSVLDERGLWMFFKRTGRQTLAVDAVRDEIRTRLFRDKLEDIDKSLHDSVKIGYNDAYFGPSRNVDKAAAGLNLLAGNSAATSAEKSGRLDPRDPVITVSGLCDAPSPSTATCRRVITSDQFEPLLKLAMLTAPKSAPPSARDVAKDYVDALIYGAAAMRAGLDKQPVFADILALARKRALSDIYQLKLEEQAHSASPGAIQDYYSQHRRHFEELQLRIVSVPKPDSTDAASRDKLSHLVTELHDRAARGEDTNKLQHDACDALGIKKVPPTAMAPIRLGSLDESIESKILALHTGQVTAPIELPTAYVIYKLEGRRTISLDEAKDEATNVLYQQKLPALKAAAARNVHVDYNEHYFSQFASQSQLAQATTHASSAK